MFDLNAIVNAALTAAIQAATEPLVTRIAALEAQSADQHQRLRVLEGALTDRVVALEEKVNFLEDQAVITSNATDKRIAALENNPAQGQDLTPAPITGLTRDEVDALIEAKMDHHLECYDHDSYDEMASKVYETDFDDYVTRDSVREEIEDVLNNATLSIRA